MLPGGYGSPSLCLWDMSSWQVVQQSLNFVLLKSVDLDCHFWLCRYLLQTLWPRERFHTLYVFNSFFFQELAQTDTSYKQSRAAFEQVKKWTKKIPIFQKDYIFIPVNQRWHVCCSPILCAFEPPLTEKALDVSFHLKMMTSLNLQNFVLEQDFLQVTLESHHHLSPGTHVRCWW